MKPLRILIVDDEPPARRKIRNFLRDEPKILDIVEAADGLAAVEMIENERPDLVLLDIQMPGMNGFELIESVGVERMPPVIFITAFDQYAVQAFEVNAIDYLLKPFSRERFHAALERIREKLLSDKPAGIEMSALYKLLESRKEFLKRILVKVGERYFFIPADEIRYISAEEKYLSLWTEKEKYLIRDTLNRMEERLDPSHFVRIHRSYIVNVDAIREIQPWMHGDAVVLMKNGDKIPLSRRFREELLKIH